MIVRILGDAQYRLDDDAFASVNEIDERVQAAIDANDAKAFASEMLHLVSTIREKGAEVGVDEFLPSDAVIPDADVAIDEVRELLSEEGLVPDSR
jgi:hypothetical protein